jgi:nucleoside-diphosphate kinase
MGLEETLVIVKPDAYSRKFEILDKFEKAGLSLVEGYTVKATEELIRDHYKNVISRLTSPENRATAKVNPDQIIDGLLKFMTSSYLFPSILAGENALSTARNLGGPKSDPQLCPPGTIRRDYSNDSLDVANAEKRAVLNAVHTSDSLAEATREIGVWFKHRNNYTNQNGLILPKQ